MNEITVPPSPNWYLSNILSHSFNGTVAWGAKHDIIIGKPTEIPNILQYSIIQHAHKLKVTSVAFTPQFEEVNFNLLASTGSDNIIKVWDAETLSLIHSHKLEASTHPVAVNWSYKKPHVLYSITSDGHVLSWNVYFNTVSSISLGKAMPTCISSCPHELHLVAVGSKRGLVYIINFQGKGNIVHKLVGHTTEVASLSWCPAENNIINGNASRDLLLTSVGNDRTIYIWKAGGDGRYETKVSIPMRTSESQKLAYKSNRSSHEWVVIDWLEPKLLLANSSCGELLSWDLSKTKDHKPDWKLVHAHHSKKVLFCIAHALKLQNDSLSDWRIRQRHQIWTLAQDRRVVCCGIQGNNVEIDYDIFTLGAFAYCIAACPLDTSNIALGIGDGMLRLWNLSEPHSTSFNTITLWKKITGKIRTIAWHPEKENLLAFATEVGEIGVSNINGNKPLILFKQYHKGIIYTIAWGPNAENRHVLYSCGDGELVYYDLERPNEDPISVFKSGCTGFSWKEDFSCLAVGFDNGSILFLNKKFETCGCANINSQMAYSLAWHPESTATDTTYSPLKNYLAVTFKKSPICILDLTNFMNHFIKLESSTDNKDSNEKIEAYNVHEVVTTLTGYNTSSIVCLAWSPYISSHLVCGSYDRITQVWNVERQELVAVYKEHKGPVLCCMWSPLDPNYIITGSADNTVRIWKLVDYLCENNVQKYVVKKSNIKQRNKGNNVADISIENSVTDLTNTITECSISDTCQVVQESVQTMIKETKKKKSGRKPHSIKHNMTDKTFLLKSMLNVVKNAKDVNKTEESQEFVNSMPAVLFSSKENLISFINNEKSRHLENSDYNHATEMDIWCDNVKQNIDEAAKEQRLNDFLVSLSASLSVKMWREMCERYAYQLKSEGNLFKAASYFLCIHKIHEAIEVYKGADLYEEAYILARCKLEPDDPVLKKILYDWTTYSVRTGNFEQAAYVYVALGEFTNAVKYLARCKYVQALTTAAEIAMLCKDENTSSKYLSEQAMLVALKNSEYDAARDIIVNFPHLKYQEIYLLTLEELENVLKEKVSFNTIDIWLNGRSNYGLLQVLKLAYGNYTNAYTELRQTNVSNNLENERMMWLAVAYELAVAVASTDEEQRLKHIVTALHTIDQYETIHRSKLQNQSSFLIEIAVKLDIKSLTDKESIYAKTDSPISTSLRAYLCNALLNWLASNEDLESNNDNMETYITLIENLLEDALNKQTVKYWSITTDINKLESRVISTMHKTSEQSTNDKDTEPLLEQLNALKAEWKQCLNDVVHVPNPVLIYSKANVLCNKLSNESIKNQFSEIISSTWATAIM